MTHEKVELGCQVEEATLHCGDEERDELLYYILAAHPGRTLVFANAVSTARRVAALLHLLKLPSAALHAGRASCPPLQTPVLSLWPKGSPAMALRSTIYALLHVQQSCLEPRIARLGCVLHGAASVRSVDAMQDTCNCREPCSRAHQHC